MNELKKKTISWLVHGELGESSKTMAFYLAFNEVYRSGQSYPRDPDDLRRCLKLLKAVPEMKQLIWAMGRLSKNWAALVAHWEEIEQCYLTEAKDGWGYIRAPKTYELMEQIQRNISV